MAFWQDLALVDERHAGSGQSIGERHAVEPQIATCTKHPLGLRGRLWLRLEVAHRDPWSAGRRLTEDLEPLGVSQAGRVIGRDSLAEFEAIELTVDFGDMAFRDLVHGGVLCFSSACHQSLQGATGRSEFKRHGGPSRLRRV
jgi:hypothetical protein